MVCIGILGSGAVGSLFAALLIDAGVAVVLVARESSSSRRRAEAMRERGLTIRRLNEKPVHLSADLMCVALQGDEALRACDLVLVCVKRPGNAWVAEALREYEGLAACAQNGTGQAEELRALGCRCRCLDGMISVCVNYHEDAPEVATYGGAEVLKLERAEGAELLRDLLVKAKFHCELVDDIASVQRTKMILNQQNAVSALFGCSVSEALASKTARRLIVTCMREAKAVFEAQGYALDQKLLGPVKFLGMPDFLFSCLFPLVIKGKLPADEFRSSMNQDLTDASRATEVLHLNGVVSENGRAAGVPTPFTDAVLRVVRDMEEGRRPREPLSADEAERIFFR